MDKMIDISTIHQTLICINLQNFSKSHIQISWVSQFQWKWVIERTVQVIIVHVSEFTIFFKIQNFSLQQND